MTRRHLIYGISAAAIAAPARKQIETVQGPIDPDSLGVTAIHEHVMVDFVGADRVSPSRYNADAVFREALPKLQELKARGCAALVECTPAYLGRDPRLLKHLSQASGVHIITNTGYYGAANDKFIPKLAWTETAEQIAQRWIREARDGIDGTGIRPGFMKIGVDSGPLSAIDAKLIHAAAISHEATGLRLHVHTGNGMAAMGIIDLLTKLDVPPSAYVWVHAQSEKDRKLHVEAAQRGAWIEFDGINPKSLDDHVRAVCEMIELGHLHNLLISQDSGWYRVGEPGGGQFNGYTYMFESFIPALEAKGVTKAQIRALLVSNPASVLTLLPSRGH
jgi:phosphotriesterase-related protein